MEWRELSLTGPSCGTVMDIDNNIYCTVVIGDQESMAENLRVSQYNNGTTIYKVNSILIWNSTNNLGFGAYGADNFDESNAGQYGYLYNGFVMYSEQNEYPMGWYVPLILNTLGLLSSRTMACSTKEAI